MGSWQLLRTFYTWHQRPSTRSQIFRRESAKSAWEQVQLPLRVPQVRLPWLAVLIIAVIVLRLGDAPLAAHCFNAILLVVLPPLVLLPSLVLWTVPLGAALAPTVVAERNAGTWDVLRMTPFSVEELLNQKAGGALWRLRGLLGSLGSLQAQVLGAVLFGLGFMEVVGSIGGLPRDRFSPQDQTLLCVGGLVLLTTAVVAFLLDRVQQLLLMVVAALAVSASSHSSRLALTRGIAATFLAWLADVAVAVAVLVLQPAGQVHGLGYSVAAVVMMGPLAGYVLALAPITVVPLVVATFALREIALRGLWRLAVRSASRV